MEEAEPGVTEMPPIRVGVLESRQLFREQLLAALADRDGLEVGWHGQDAGLAPDDLDVLIVDSRLRWDVQGRRSVDLAGRDSVDQLAQAVLNAPPSPVREAHPRLTPREREVLMRVAAGDSAADTAQHLGISARTVERHKQALLAKLGVRSQAEAMARAASLGLLADG